MHARQMPPRTTLDANALPRSLCLLEGLGSMARSERQQVTSPRQQVTILGGNARATSGCVVGQHITRWQAHQAGICNSRTCISRSRCLSRSPSIYLSLPRSRYLSISLYLVRAIYLSLHLYLFRSLFRVLSFAAGVAVGKQGSPKDQKRPYLQLKELNFEEVHDKSVYIGVIQNAHARGGTFRRDVIQFLQKAS